MLSRVVITAVLVLAAMVAVKQNVLHQTGLTGSCAAVQTLSDGSQWLMCTAGKVGGGRPSLASHSCTSAGLRGTAEWWHCPAQIVSSAAGQ